MADVDLTPTAEMARNAARGLELRREHGRGGTEVGVARARDISNGKTLSPETVRRMHAFFSRHAKNKAGGEDDAGYIAWMLWSGDAGRDWAKRKVEELDRKERNAMSETRKAIMDRLGMAAQKVARFRVGKDLSGGYSVVPMKADGSVETSVYEEIGFRHSFPTADAALAKAKQMQAKYGGTVTMEDKQVSSRPGAKAKMGMEAKYPQAFRDAMQLMQQFEDLEPTSALKQAASDLGIPEGAEMRKFVEWANKRIRASRPGAKAKMATARDVKEAKAAGLRVGDIVRYKDIVDPDDRKWRARIVELRGPRLLVSNDVMPEFRDWALPPSTSVMVDEVVKASRPGVKVRAALADACWEGYEAVGTKPQDGKTVPNCVPKMKAGRAEDLYRKLSGGTITNANVREWDRLVTEALRMPDFTPPGGDMSLHEIAEELGGEITALKSRAAKAQAAKPAETPAMRELQRKMQELMQKADRLLKQSLSASVTSEQSQQMQDEVARISDQLDAMGEDLARQRKAAGFEKPSDLEREDVKAGLKLMAASDPAVSDKIRKLIKEGKPQDQAVAIALDMKRRGEL